MSEDVEKLKAEVRRLEAELVKAKQVRNRAERDRVKAESSLSTLQAELEHQRQFTAQMDGCRNPDYCGTADADNLCAYCASDAVQQPLRMLATLSEIEAAADYSLDRSGQRTRSERFTPSQAKWLKETIKRAK